jgi:hypothetical protein
MLDDESQFASPHVVRCERPRHLATSAVRAKALSSVPRLSDGTRMLLDQKFKRGERGCWNDRSKPFWERCEPRWQTGLAPLFSCADGTDPPHKQAAGFEILHTKAGSGAGDRRGLSGQIIRDYYRIFRSVKVRRSMSFTTYLAMVDLHILGQVPSHNISRKSDPANHSIEV